VAGLAPGPYTVPMAHPDPSLRRMTVEEFLDWEDAQLARHELVAGEAYAMSGATLRHNEISLNVASLLRSSGRAIGCRTYMADVRLRVGDDVVYYPDVVVACGALPADERIVDAPCLVVEVLSPSTRRTDRHEKAAVYETIPSLGAYLIVEQDRRLVERRWRDADGAWRRETLDGDGTIPLPCPPGHALPLDAIYEGVELPPPDEALRLREAEAEYA